MSLTKIFVFLNRKFLEYSDNGSHSKINKISNFLTAIFVNYICELIEFEFMLYKALPLRLLSRLWGQFAAIKITKPFKSLIFGLYVYWFGVNMDEAEIPSLIAYESLAELFCRKLKNGVRRIGVSMFVSPCDGTVVSCGLVSNNKIEKVKGITYNVDEFLGQKISSEYRNLFQCVIYLAPGDYHRFHSPCNWSVKQRLHFPGKLLSVSPWLVKLIPGLFCMNERVVYDGFWQHGFFSMTAVGATNVGSIQVYADEELQTNVRSRTKPNEYVFEKHLNLEKGDFFGHFNMGSTIVLIFQAPKDFEFAKSVGDRVKMGESLIAQ